MDKNLKYLVLLGLALGGGYLIWKGKYLQDWFPDLFGDDAAAKKKLSDDAEKKALANPTDPAAQEAARKLKADADAAAETARLKKKADADAAALKQTDPTKVAPGTIFNDSGGGQQMWDGSKFVPVAAKPLDTRGLVVHLDINDSLTGTVKLFGVPTMLSIITTDGRIFDTTGSEVTSVLQSKGIDVGVLRAAFANADVGLSGLGWIS